MKVLAYFSLVQVALFVALLLLDGAARKRLKDWQYSTFYIGGVLGIVASSVLSMVALACYVAFWSN